jgi:hypothetical protein
MAAPPPLSADEAIEVVFEAIIDAILDMIRGRRQRRADDRRTRGGRRSRKRHR